MKVGFFGGSFDPPHRGHIALARLAIEQLELDRVLIAPVGTQPLKRDQGAATPFDDRVAMVQLAIAGEPRMEVSLVDAPRKDGRPNYTIDTVNELRQTLSPDDTLYCLMGADSFLTIGKWDRAGELLLLCNFVVGSRPGFNLQKVAAALPESVSLAAETGSAPGRLVIGLRGQNGKESRLCLLPDLAEDISATEIRSELRMGRPTSIDPAVAAYIQRHGLYPSKEAGSSVFPGNRKS
ncbi:nicotinate-nucleotide adenylyltransferase [Silvibacterium bohemicum]|uniref:Probable nicotinate-nucleotide adenylyltransferase n=1 Tax=Silvibacterium bohemicum TaxID=1577686 RepID=A0A841JWD0_9BACT|nr:nicotinate (nicotinamide) nucleotide adenylyltransferase [Silvibacterium bohemicum]MBB6145656.1 nicotinate-nucleotide adenylyltransferase [Silvibacterium bohemicum]